MCVTSYRTSNTLAVAHFYVYNEYESAFRFIPSLLFKFPFININPVQSEIRRPAGRGIVLDVSLKRHHRRLLPASAVIKKKVTKTGERSPTILRVPATLKDKGRLSETLSDQVVFSLYGSGGEMGAGGFREGAGPSRHNVTCEGGKEPCSGRTHSYREEGEWAYDRVYVYICVYVCVCAL